MRFVPLLSFLCLAFGVWAPAYGQAPKPSGPKNLVSNGGFETGFRRDNLWYGVNSAGYLASERESVPVLTLGGSISETAMPLSVSVADLNGDNLLDLAVMDVIGYMRVYFNSGTAQQPKFTVGELVGVFLTRIGLKDPLLGGVRFFKARFAPRIFLTDIMKSGKKDLIIGNYFGEVLLIPNDGTIQKPDFRQPADIARVLIPTMKDSNLRWGNVFSPATWDWNKDGKEDLLLGEGSYSANNIHLLVNMSSSNKPAFDESNRHVLAYGDGREQLAVCVVDYNSDGNPDLLVADRTGQISLYLNTGKPWNRGETPPEIPFASYIGGATPLKFNGISTIATGDLNGDGLFDLVVGKANGRVAMALNSGTKTEPKFTTQTEIKGEGTPPPLSIPSNWDVDYGLLRGNFYGFVSVVKAEEDKDASPPEGKACLKVGYMPSPNKIIPVPSVYSPELGPVKLETPNFNNDAETIVRDASARTFIMRQLGRFRLKNNTTYTLSYKVKGTLADGLAMVGWQGEKKLSEAKEVRGERGSVQRKENKAEEGDSATQKFSASSSWKEYKTDFKVGFKNADLKDLKETTTAFLQFTFTMPQGGVAYFDDVKIVEK